MADRRAQKKVLITLRFEGWQPQTQLFTEHNKHKLLGPTAARSEERCAAVMQKVW